MGIRRRTDGGRRSDAEELAVYRTFVQQLTRTCQAAARGDLEARSRPTAGVADVPELQALNDGVNNMLDVSDASVRVDGSASLGAGVEDVTGLSQLAERLRSEATGFLAAMRR